MPPLAYIAGVHVTDVPPTGSSASAIKLSTVAAGGAVLTPDDVAELRDALTEWLERVGRSG